ncbi:MAG TPA: S8 family serine peptidase [Anaerolineales bacterium]|nr:S8 family serine peptidase [Anaerolineales bacterium]
MVLYNNQPGSVTPTVAPVAPLTTPITIPVVMISQADGNLIDTRLASGPVTLTWTNQTVETPVATAGLISSFSSYGLAPDLSLKPDIGAPGGNIWSTYPLEKGGYANVSGTSMASPHVAGAVALLLQARPSLKANEVRDILQNSADPMNWWGNPALGFLDNVHRQGAGMLDIDDSILSKTTITPGKIATGEGQSGPFVQQLRVKNSGSSSVTYNLSYVNALSTSGVITPGFTTSSATVAFSAGSVTVAAGKTATVTATINPATGPLNGQYGGYIVFTPQGGGQTYRVPFAGFVGDYQGIQVLTPTANNFPRLGWTPDGVNFGFAAAGDTFTLQGFDVPYILIHFDHQVQVFQIRIYNANGSPVDPDHNFALQEEYVGRNSTTTGFFAYAWDGTRLYNRGNDKVKIVPDGSYYLVVEALKANGTPGNPAHWETWTSPTFNIDRP